MRAIRNTSLVAILAIATAACEDGVGPQQQQSILLDDAFASMLLGFNNTFSSFDAGLSGGVSPWIPTFTAARGPGQMGGGPRGGHMSRDPRGSHHGPGGGFMGGGLGLPFIGGGVGHHGIRLPSNCVFDAASGRVVCPVATHNGLTISLSVAYHNAAGTAQQAFDPITTNSINTRVSVSGTMTRRDSSTTTVQHASERTVGGLAAGSTQRTINGTSAGSESTNGRNRAGQQFTAQRVMGDTIRGVVIPVRTDSVRTFPSAGTVIRAMRATVTVAGSSPVTSSRREVITYNGTNTATLVITQNDSTRTCTVPLPFGRPVCP